MGWLRNWRRKRIAKWHRIDDALWGRVVLALPFVGELSLDESDRLRESTLLFLAEKSFSGTHGLVISDLMRVSIAAQACLLVLELGLDWYAGWSGIVVYPGDFRVRRTETDESGVVHVWNEDLAGEAMYLGPVVLSWDAATHDPGMNVVIHEFAHKLDMANGQADGMPALHEDMDRRGWASTLSEAYRGFCDALERGQSTWLDAYAAEDPAEFFAVMSEAFFEMPLETRRRYPGVYEQLALFYRQDPAARLKL